MERKDNPCLDCKDREVGCHSKCEKYSVWLDDLHKKKNMIKQNKQAYYLSIGHTIDATYRNSKKRHRK